MRGILHRGLQTFPSSFIYLSSETGEGVDLFVAWPLSVILCPDGTNESPISSGGDGVGASCSAPSGLTGRYSLEVGLTETTHSRLLISSNTGGWHDPPITRLCGFPSPPPQSKRSHQMGSPSTATGEETESPTLGPFRKAKGD